MALKKNDFIEIEFTGKEKDSGMIFDTTDKNVAMSAGIFSSKADYGPVTICVGDNQILKSLDNELIGKNIGVHTIVLSSENAFGNKNPKLIQLISTTKFRKQGLNPVVGMQVNIDGTSGIIKSVGGGRTLVDFNHPLSGRDIVYEINIKNIITDVAKKFDSLMKNKVGLKEMKTSVEGKTAKLSMEFEVPKQVQDLLKTATLQMIPEITDVIFENVAEKKNTSQSNDSSKSDGLSVTDNSSQDKTSSVIQSGTQKKSGSRKKKE